MPNRSTPARNGDFELPRLAALLTATVLGTLTTMASAPASRAIPSPATCVR